LVCVIAGRQDMSRITKPLLNHNPSTALGIGII